MSFLVGYAWMAAALNAPDSLGPNKARVAGVNSLQRLPEGTLLVPAPTGAR